MTAGRDRNNVSGQLVVHESWIDSTDLTVGMEVAYLRMLQTRQT